MGNETSPCPDYPFELQARETYAIANLEHVGEYIERSVIKTSDLIHNNAILDQLKVRHVEIRALNTTKMNTAYQSFMTKLSAIPEKMSLKSYTADRMLT